MFIKIAFVLAMLPHVLFGFDKVQQKPMSNKQRRREILQERIRVQEKKDKKLSKILYQRKLGLIDKKRPVIITVDDICETVKKKIYNVKKTSEYDSFIKLLRNYANYYGEIRSLQRLSELESRINDWIKTFSPDAIIYQALSVTLEKITEIEKSIKKCCICLDQSLHDAIRLECCDKPIFCFDCLLQWYVNYEKANDQHTKCPLCRSSISDTAIKELKKSNSYFDLRKIAEEKNGKKTEEAIQENFNTAQYLDREWQEEDDREFALMLELEVYEQEEENYQSDESVEL